MRALTLHFTHFFHFHPLPSDLPHTHTHTYIYIYIYIYAQTLISVCLCVFVILFSSLLQFYHSVLTISINCTAVQECIKLNQVSKFERSIVTRCVFVCLPALLGIAWLGSVGGGGGDGYFSLYKILLPYTQHLREHTHTNLISGQLCLILFIGNPEHFTCFCISIDIILWLFG